MTLWKRAVEAVVLAAILPFFAFGQSNVETIRCSIQSQPGTVAAGETVKLTWSSFGAKSASIEGIGSVQTSGNRTVTPTASRTYKLTVVSSKNQPYSCETSVTVVAARPSCFITVWPTSITEGQNATVSWGSSHATSLFITGLGSVLPSGTRTVRPSHTTTYAISAKGESGICTETAHIVVNKQESKYGYFPNVIKSLFSPFIPQSNKGNLYDTTYEDTWYFDDKGYDEWEEYEYDEYSDDSYDDYIDDDYYYDDYAEDYYDDTYVDEYEEADDCWWDWWCGNSSLNDTVQETYDEWDTNYDQRVGHYETYYDYAENYYFQDTVYYYPEE